MEMKHGKAKFGEERWGDKAGVHKKLAAAQGSG